MKGDVLTVSIERTINDKTTAIGGAEVLALWDFAMTKINTSNIRSHTHQSIVMGESTITMLVYFNNEREMKSSRIRRSRTLTYPCNEAL